MTVILFDPMRRMPKAKTTVATLKGASQPNRGCYNVTLAFGARGKKMIVLTDGVSAILDVVPYVAPDIAKIADPYLMPTRTEAQQKAFAIECGRNLWVHHDNPCLNHPVARLETRRGKRVLVQSNGHVFGA